jgi:hypothetical protein
MSSLQKGLEAAASLLATLAATVGLSLDFCAIAAACLGVPLAVAAISIASQPGPGSFGSLRRRLRRHAAIVWLLAGCLLTTAMLWNAARLHMQRADQARFESSIETLRLSLAGRVERYEDTLVTLRSALQVLGPDEVEQWDKFSRSISGKDLPAGIQFLGVFEMRPASLSSERHAPDHRATMRSRRRS